MCNERKTTKIHVNYRDRFVKVDRCIAPIIREMQKQLCIVSCCCGHGKYPMTIVFLDERNSVRELFSDVVIPRNQRIYVKDKEGFYYIPEVNRQKLKEAVK